MNWNDWSDFWQMGGVGRFVWGSWGIALLLMAVEAVASSRRLKQAKALVAQGQEDAP